MVAREEAGPILNGIPSQLPDIDAEETQEWLDSLDGVIDEGGRTRARYVMLKLLERARQRQVGVPSLTATDYINTIPPEVEPWFPGDEDVERRYRAFLRWNAAVMVHRAQRPDIGVGGHLSSYASAATLYEVGFNHFFRGQDHEGGGDQVFIQGHASPGVYARAFLEGRLSEEQLDGFRQEHSHVVDGKPLALSSYPHPRLMPDFWEFPTVSMGLGPMNAIYQAQFNKYLKNRGIKDTSQQHVWAFLGDGEMDEPESRGLLQLAANEELDNLTFVVNCNLQRLDGPVRGNGKIIQELEAFFRGAGWNVIKVVWGRGWDPLLAADRDGALVNIMNETSDGDYQTFRANDGAYVREHFFGRDPAHPRDGRGLVRRRRVVEAQARRPRLPQGLRGVQGGHRAHRSADGDPGQDDQGLRPGVALRRPQRDPPDEEVHPRRPQGPARLAAHPDHRRAARGQPLPAAVLPPRQRRPDDPVPARAPQQARWLRCRSAGWSTRRSSCRPSRRTTGSSAGRASSRSPPPWRSCGC